MGALLDPLDATHTWARVYGLLQIAVGLYYSQVFPISNLRALQYAAAARVVHLLGVALAVMAFGSAARAHRNLLRPILLDGVTVFLTAREYLAMHIHARQARFQREDDERVKAGEKPVGDLLGVRPPRAHKAKQG